MAATPPAAARIIIASCHGAAPSPGRGPRPGAIVTVTARRSEAGRVIPAEASRGAAPRRRPVTVTGQAQHWRQQDLAQVAEAAT
jgi:hypothetical protein